jgi:hypothetical protein
MKYITLILIILTLGCSGEMSRRYVEVSYGTEQSGDTGTSTGENEIRRECEINGQCDTRGLSSDGGHSGLDTSTDTVAGSSDTGTSSEIDSGTSGMDNGGSDSGCYDETGELPCGYDDTGEDTSIMDSETGTESDTEADTDWQHTDTATEHVDTEANDTDTNHDTENDTESETETGSEVADGTDSGWGTDWDSDTSMGEDTEVITLLWDADAHLLVTWTEGLNACALVGWRLPTIEEAQSILMSPTGNGCWWDESIFGDLCYEIWTRNPAIPPPYNQQTVNFVSGESRYHPYTKQKYALCVLSV